MKKECSNHAMYRFFLSFALCFSFIPIVFCQNVKVNVQAPESALVGEQFRINYIVESDKKVDGSIIIKNMEAFTILYGPSSSTSTSVTFKNGKRVSTYSSTTTYVVEAQKEGKFTLPKGEITLDGKKYKSNMFKIEVKSPAEKVEDIDAFIKVITSKTGVNLSDTLMLTYRLYTTKEIERITNFDLPFTDGFYSTDITRLRQSFSEEVIKDKTYKVIDLKQLILQPRKIGQITMPEGQVVVEYSVPTGRQVRDVWGDIYNETISSEKILKIEPLTIRVQDLKAI